MISHEWNLCVSARKSTNKKMHLFKHRISGDHLLRGEDGDWLPRVYADIESRLAVHSASQFLKQLVDLGCKRKDLLYSLVWIGPYAKIEDSREAITGFPRSKLKTALKRMRLCADDVELLLSLGHTESLLIGGPESSIQKEFPFVPANLRLYADYVEGVRDDSSLRPRSHFTRNCGISHLVSTVKAVTGEYHDEAVSALLAAVLNRPDYGEQAHREWRSEQRKSKTPADKFMDGQVEAWARAVRSPDRRT